MKMKRTTRKEWKTDTGVQLALWSWPERTERKPKGAAAERHNPFDLFS